MFINSSVMQEKCKCREFNILFCFLKSTDAKFAKPTVLVCVLLYINQRVFGYFNRLHNLEILSRHLSYTTYYCHVILAVKRIDHI